MKKILTNDPRWQDFLKKMAQCKKRFVKSSLAFLTPPMVPDQGRYMNLEGLLNWATRVRAFMDHPTANDGSLVEPWRVNLEFAWLRDFDEPLAEWQELMQVVETTLHFVRWEGYHRDAHCELHARLIFHAEHPLSHQLCEQVVNFVAEQSLAAKPDERLIGSSECIESLIGKGKRLEGQQSRSGFTAMVLGIAAAVVKPTQQVIESALAAAVQNKTVYSTRPRRSTSSKVIRQLKEAAGVTGGEEGTEVDRLRLAVFDWLSSIGCPVFDWLSPRFACNWTGAGVQLGSWGREMANRAGVGVPEEPENEGIRDLSDDARIRPVNSSLDYDVHSDSVK